MLSIEFVIKKIVCIKRKMMYNIISGYKPSFRAYEEV